VIDTNFIISHLSIVRNLVDLYSASKGLVLVPWVVIQELDGLKSASSSYGQANLAVLSRNAIRYIYESLNAEKVGLRGQKISECLNSRETGDDSILDCARYWAEKQRVQVILLSNDKNLGTKVMIHGIGAICHEKGLTANEILERILENWKFQEVGRQKDSLPAISLQVQEDPSSDSEMQDHNETTELVLPSPSSPAPADLSSSGVVEMQTDPVIAPLFHKKMKQIEEPFKALQSMSGPSRYASNSRPVPIRGKTPASSQLDRTALRSQSPDEHRSRSESPNTARSYSPEAMLTIGQQNAARRPSQTSTTSNSDSQNSIMNDLEDVILRTFPSLIRQHLMREFGNDEDSVNFLLGSSFKQPTIVGLLRVLSDNWMPVFSAVMPSYGRTPDVHLRSLASSLQRNKNTHRTKKQTDSMIGSWASLWRALAVDQDVKYKAKMDRKIQKWLNSTDASS